MPMYLKGFEFSKKKAVEMFGFSPDDYSGMDRAIGTYRNIVNREEWSAVID